MPHDKSFNEFEFEPDLLLSNALAALDRVKKIMYTFETTVAP